MPVLPETSVVADGCWLVIAAPGHPVVRVDVGCLDSIAVEGGRLHLEVEELVIALEVEEGPVVARSVQAQLAPYARRSRIESEAGYQDAKRRQLTGARSGSGASAESSPLLVGGRPVVAKDDRIDFGEFKFLISQVAQYAERGMNVPLPDGGLIRAAIPMILVALRARAERAADEDLFLLSSRIADYVRRNRPQPSQTSSMTTSDPVGVFLRAVEGVRLALAQHPAESSGDHPVAQTLNELRGNADAVAYAEQLLSKALVDFPLHPYLLTWRANVRARLALALIHVEGDTLLLPESSGAVEDLELALRVAPDYIEPRLELAFHALYQADDAVEAVERFSKLIEPLARRLCDCAAGLVEALRELGRTDDAQRELDRWSTAFPDSVRLQALQSS